jgi:hypothetical protein
VRYSAKGVGSFLEFPFINIKEDAIHFIPHKQAFVTKIDERKKRKFKYVDYPHINDLVDDLLSTMHRTIFGQ